MSLVVTVFVPSGIVMAADSRMSVTRTEDHEDESGQKTRTQQQLVLSDSAYKVVEFRKVAAGISVYDAGVIDNQPMESQVHRFEEEAVTEADDVTSLAEKFLDYFKTRHPALGVGFQVAGYKLEKKVSVPYVLVGHTTREPILKRANANNENVLTYGVSQGGDNLVSSRVIDANYLPHFNLMPLQDAVDYAVHLIRTTIETMRFEPRYPSVGGPIDVLVIKPDGMEWVQRKELRGED